MYLNDKYELDGRGPNAVAGVLWCFGLFDEGFTERPVVGKLRWMSSIGLERKFNIREYVRNIELQCGNNLEEYLPCENVVPDLEAIQDEVIVSGSGGFVAVKKETAATKAKQKSKK